MLKPLLPSAAGNKKLLRAVLDTNVIVSAFLQHEGTPGRLVKLLLDGTFTVVLSPQMVNELTDTLLKPSIRKSLSLSSHEISGRVAQIETIADLVEGGIIPPPSLRDPDAAIVLAAAVHGQVDYIVTGDEDLLVLKEYQGILIVKPRTFLDLLPD